MGNMIRRKIFFSYALPMLLSLSLLAGLCYGLIRYSFSASEDEKLVILADHHSSRIESLLRERRSILRRVETLDFRRNFRELALASHFAKFREFFPVMSFLNRQGREELKVVKGKLDAGLQDHAQALWFAEALTRKNEIVIGGIAVSPELDVPCLTLAVARFGYFGDEFEGVLKVEIPLADLTADLGSLSLGRSGYAVLVDARGTVLFHPDAGLLFKTLPGADRLPNFRYTDRTAPAAAGVIELAGAKVVVGRAPVSGLGWSVLTVLPYREYAAPLLLLAVYTFAAVLFAILLGLWVANRIAQPIVRNLGKVMDHANLIAAGELSQTLEINSRDEFESLSESLNQMTTDIARTMAARDSLQNVLQSIIDPLVLLDGDFHILDVNLAAVKLLDTDKQDLIGVHFCDFLADKSADAELSCSEIRASGALHNYELQLLLADGKYVPVLFSCSVPDPELHTGVGLVAILKDVSALKQAEEASLQALTFNEALLDQSPLGIRVFDGASGRCVSVNPAAAKIAGGSIESLLDQNFRKLDPWKVAKLLPVAEDVLTDGKPRQLATELATTFGNQLRIRYFFSRVMVKDRPHLLVIGQDITEEQRLVEKNRQYQAQMLHVQKLESLGIMAGGIAHDFNNILMTVMGNADLALLELPAESAARNHLREISKASRRAAELAGQMLAYSGRGTFNIEALDINRIVEDMLPMLKASTSKRAILRFSPAVDLPAIEADPTQIRQLLMNIIINASEAIGDKSGVVEAATGVVECSKDDLRETWLDEDLDPGRYVFCEIADTGCGMEHETLSRIFDPFFSTKFTGRGLGMAAALGIIRGHKGAIKVSSEVGKGTTFRVLLPQSARQPVAPVASEQDPDGQAHGTVLLVDDEPSVRTVGKRMLEMLGYKVLTATGGREALALYRKLGRDIHLVLMDLTMPQMGGEEAFRELRQVDPEIKVFLSSGYSEQEISGLLADGGLAGFIQKPYQIAQLEKILLSSGAV